MVLVYNENMSKREHIIISPIKNIGAEFPSEQVSQITEVARKMDPINPRPKLSPALRYLVALGYERWRSENQNRTSITTGA